MSKPEAKLDAADRVTLYLALVPYLIHNSPASVTEVAQKFHVDPADLRDLVLKLSNLGIPGSEGYYLPNDLFEINFDLLEEEDVIDLLNSVGIDSTPRFSGTEAATLVAGLQFISGIIAAEDRGAIHALIQKIGMGASSQPADIIVDTPEPPVDLAIVHSAFDTRTQINFGYRNARGISEVRHVSPLGLDLVGETWYLRGWCHLRGALRTFRLDRMENLGRTAVPTPPAIAHTVLSEVLFDARDTDLAVVIQLAENALPLISEYHPTVLRSAVGGDVLVSVHFADLTNVARIITRYPGVMTVVEPATAVAGVARFTGDALARYA